MLLKMAGVICAISPFQAKEPNIVQPAINASMFLIITANG
jgi:hypothetical protein